MTDWQDGVQYSISNDGCQCERLVRIIVKGILYIYIYIYI